MHGVVILVYTESITHKGTAQKSVFYFSSCKCGKYVEIETRSIRINTMKQHIDSVELEIIQIELRIVAAIFAVENRARDQQLSGSPERRTAVSSDQFSKHHPRECSIPEASISLNQCLMRDATRE